MNLEKNKERVNFNDFRKKIWTIKIPKNIKIYDKYVHHEENTILKSIDNIDVRVGAFSRRV